MDNKINFKDIAENCLAKCNGNVADATKMMEGFIRKDAALYRALMDPLVKEACFSIVRALNRSQNQIIWKRAQAQRDPHQGQSVRHLAEGMLGWNVLGGKKLGDCTRGDLSRAIKLYSTQAIDMQQKANLLQAISDQMPDDETTVREVFTPKDLSKLEKNNTKSKTGEVHV